MTLRLPIRPFAAMPCEVPIAGCLCVRHWTTTASCYNNLFQRLAGASIIRVDSGTAVAPATAGQYVIIQRRKQTNACR